MGAITTWIPVINEVVKWALSQISKSIGPSKSELQLNIADLEKQLQYSMEQNRILSTHLVVIESLILQSLAAKYHCNIADGIISPGENTLSIPCDSPSVPGDTPNISPCTEICENTVPRSDSLEKEASHIFDNIDDEIEQMRKKYPGK